jgi:spore coat protein A
VLKNANPPAPVSTPAPSLTAVMQIRVGTTVTVPGPATIPASLPGRAANLPTLTTIPRFITLNEVGAGTAGWFLNLNGAHFDEGGETPHAGTVEDWIYINLTPDTHPMHTHLVTHQVVGRTPFNVNAYIAAVGVGPGGVPGGHDPQPFATVPMQPPAPEERGFKDTTKANPGYFTTIRAKFDLPDSVSGPQVYVHHCHIVEHEDNDMMEPFTVA